MRESTNKGLFWHIGQAMYRFRWVVLICWIAIFISSGLLAQKTPALLKDSGFTPVGSEAELGLQELQEHLQIPLSAMNLIFESEEIDLTKPEVQQSILQSLEQVERLPYVESVYINTAERLPDHEGILSVVVAMNLVTDEAIEIYLDFKELIQAPEGMKVHLTGATPIIYDMQEASKNDIIKAELIGIPIAMIVLLIIFGTVLGAILPLIVGLMSVTVTLGITFFIASEVTLSNFLPNIVTMLGLGVGIDYALFMVSRFREELRKTGDVQAAVAMMVQTAGKSIFFSGVAVLIGLLSMFLIDLNLFYSLSLGGSLVVCISVLVATTLLPALLGLFGHRINKWNVIPQKWRRLGNEQTWGKIAYGVMKRPISLVLIVGLILFALMLPVGSMKMELPDAEVLPPSYESRYGDQLFNEAYDSREANPIQIAVISEDEPIWDAKRLAQVQAYLGQIEAFDHVKDVKSFMDVIEANPALSQIPIEQALQNEQLRSQLQELKLMSEQAISIIVVPEYYSGDSKLNQLVEDLRGIDQKGLNILVTGGPAYNLDTVNRITDQIPAVLMFVMGITYLVLMFAFRSVVLPLKAVLMNVFSLGASLGIVVIVFQMGYFADLFQITSIGYVSATIPILIFCVVFGISMDYEVFLISRIIEEYEKTGDNEKSTAEGLKKTGSLITSAAFILVVVVGTFIFTDIEIMKALGLGLSLAVLIDATIIRIVFVPALMKLLGKWNWIAPRWLK